MKRSDLDKRLEILEQRMSPKKAYAVVLIPPQAESMEAWTAQVAAADAARESAEQVIRIYNALPE